MTLRHDAVFRRQGRNAGGRRTLVRGWGNARGRGLVGVSRE